MTAAPLDALDIIEWSFRYGVVMLADLNVGKKEHYQIRMSIDDAVVQLNRYFRLHDLGFNFSPVRGVISHVDSEYAHRQIMLPAMALLQDAGFRGANDEFARAHY